MDNSSSSNNADSKILVTIEDGCFVFKKRQESVEEVIFYNTDYFKRIGFPDAEVSIGKITPDGLMKGGYYNQPEKITYPFRQFVYLLQGDDNSNRKDDDINRTPQIIETNEHTPNFFERLSTYGVQISNGVQSGIDRIRPYFKSTESSTLPEPNNLVIEQSPSRLTEVEPPKLEEENKRNEEEKKEEETGDIDKDIYWIVKVPIINDDSIIPKNEYEKEESMLRQRLLENKVEKSLGKSKKGKMYEVGSRYIVMCEEVTAFTPIKVEGDALPGSIKYKMSKVEKRV